MAEAICSLGNVLVITFWLHSLRHLPARDVDQGLSEQLDGFTLVGDDCEHRLVNKPEAGRLKRDCGLQIHNLRRQFV